MFTAQAENEGNLIRIGQFEPSDQSLFFLLIVMLILLLLLMVLLPACCA